MPKLTDKQKKFCKYVATGKNATQAAKKAGYSAKTAKQMGTENLSKPYLNEVIAKEAQKQQAKFEAEFDYTSAAHFKELDALEDLAKKRGDLPTALKAAIQKGKLCGLYMEKIEATIKEPRRFVVEIKK